MQPAEIFDLIEGEQQQWQRHVLLTAWQTWFLAMSIPTRGRSGWRSGCERFPDFLERFAPPGYRPDPKKRATSASRRAVRS